MSVPPALSSFTCHREGRDCVRGSMAVVNVLESNFKIPVTSQQKYPVVRELKRKVHSYLEFTPKINSLKPHPSKPHPSCRWLSFGTRGGEKRAHIRMEWKGLIKHIFKAYKIIF